jgi:hypothetical protein
MEIAEKRQFQRQKLIMVLHSIPGFEMKLEVIILRLTLAIAYFGKC